MDHARMLGVCATNSIHGRQLSYRIGSDQGHWKALDSGIAVCSICGVELVTCPQPCKLWDLEQFVQKVDYGGASVN